MSDDLLDSILQPDDYSIGLNEPQATVPDSTDGQGTDPRDDYPPPVWVLFDAECAPHNGLDYAVEADLRKRLRAHVTAPKQPQPGSGSPARWYSLEHAASLLGEEGPDGLRKKFARAARIGADGVVHAEIDGVTARKMGKLWKVRLSPEWLATTPSARRGRR